MKIAKNVEMIELAGAQGSMYPVLVRDDRNVILVDTGLPGQLELIRAGVEQTGHSLSQITAILLTHHDMDHIGNAKVIREHGAKVMAHEKEIPYIQGDAPSPKLTTLEERLKNASPEERAMYERLKANTNLHVHVDAMLKDGETLPFCGGIEIIYTPGHTPGHICVWLKDSNILITGDAANISNGELTGPNPRHTLDMVKAEESFEKLKKLHPDFIVCYHGGLLRSLPK